MMATIAMNGSQFLALGGGGFIVVNIEMNARDMKLVQRSTIAQMESGINGAYSGGRSSRAPILGNGTIHAKQLKLRTMISTQKNVATPDFP